MERARFSRVTTVLCGFADRPRARESRRRAVVDRRRPTAAGRTGPFTSRCRTWERILVALARDPVPLLREACLHARAAGETEIYALRVRPARERGAATLAEAEGEARRLGLRLVSLPPRSREAAEAVARAAEDVRARVVFLEGVERRGLISRVLGRRALRRIRRRLPGRRMLIVCA